MTALAERKPDGALAPNEPRQDPFMALILKAADKPELIPQIKELNELRIAEINRQARVAFDTDFALMQPKLPTIDRNGKIEIRKKDKDGERTGDVQQKSPYALWADILEACSPAMLEHGFGISFRHSTADDGKIKVTGILSHRDGHREENSIALIHENSGSKNAVQAIGSSLSYGMRYMGIMLLGVASKAEDDDGKAAGAQVEEDDITPERLKFFTDLVYKHNADQTKLLAAVGCDSLTEITSKQLRDATAKLEAWAKANGK